MFTGRILALDLATETGWAFGAPGTTPRFGSLRFGAVGTGRAQVYRAFRVWLNNWIVMEQPELVVFESAALPMAMQGRTNANTIKMLIGMCEHTEELCHDRVELREAMASQVRAHFLGSNRFRGAEAKRLTIECCNRLGWPVANHNAADALALWHYQVCCLRPDIAARANPLFGGAKYF